MENRIENMDIALLQPKFLKELCAQHGLRPSKSYGQHFLISDVPVKKIIAVAALEKTDTVIEIGPGFGILTLAMAPLVKQVIAFEIEKKLQPYWAEKQKEFPNIEIVWGNALNQFQAESYKLKAKSYKVIANLPYQITSDVFRLFLEEVAVKPERLVVMVQKEVAERMVAKPGDMSLLSVAVQYYGEPRIVADVKAGSFWPPPKVDSAIVAIEVFAPKHLSTEAQNFFRVVRAGFSQKRKQVWHNLVAALSLDPKLVKKALRDVVGNEKVRAQNLSVGEWMQLVEILH